MSANTPTSESEPCCSSSISGRSTSIGLSSNVTSVGQNVAEHRRLFNYAGARTKQSGKGNKGKKSVSQCSLKFMCMSHCNVEKPPTSVKDRTALSNAGLGDAVIAFNSDGDNAHFHGKLLEKFPLLATSGYELLMHHRGGDESAFCSLKYTSQNGYWRWLDNAKYI